jgi:hypothetical protein
MPLASNNLEVELKDAWEAAFIKRYTINPQVIEMLSFANFLNISPLFELCCACIAAQFKGKNFDQAKKEFGLEDETYTPEEEEELQQRFPWVINEVVKKID